ncbi:hypothetical protein [Sinorhizobium psoraleae]|uniref:Uncharacterized protein n=1 Tax=Sinorhizobium psoraleae TaxID=520838 RepID=A0ABT4KBT0_9HYPH|nr:hypothetical protein [Sinorhizobium psoraleae]MCZ4089372.1 hypothetical protein [Sinorhizobium psoraleae]
MRASQEINVTVTFDGGAIIGKYPFWMPDAKIVDAAISRLPFPREMYRNVKVERGDE